jgi:hypothetical protein
MPAYLFEFPDEFGRWTASSESDRVISVIFAKRLLVVCYEARVLTRQSLERLWRSEWGEQGLTGIKLQNEYNHGFGHHGTKVGNTHINFSELYERVSVASGTRVKLTPHNIQSSDVDSGSRLMSKSCSGETCSNGSCIREACPPRFLHARHISRAFPRAEQACRSVRM